MNQYEGKMMPANIDKVMIGNPPQATLYHADCMDVLPMLDKVDIVITDPPYGISQECNLTADGQKNYGRVDFGEWDIEFPYEILPLLITLNAGTYYIFAPYQALGKLSDWSHENKFLERVLWWVKSNPTRRNCNAYWAIPGEHIFYAKRPGAMFNAKYQIGYFTHPIVAGDHPTQKPVEIISVFIEASTVAGDIILDPYMGSGSSGVAALKLKRKFIGIEICPRPGHPEDPDYFGIAVERISKEANQIKMEFDD